MAAREELVLHPNGPGHFASSNLVLNFRELADRVGDPTHWDIVKVTDVSLRHEELLPSPRTQTLGALTFS